MVSSHMEQENIYVLNPAYLLRPDKNRIKRRGRCFTSLLFTPKEEGTASWKVGMLENTSR